MKFIAKLFARNESQSEQNVSAPPPMSDHETRLQAPVASPSTLDAIQQYLFAAIESTQGNFFIQGQAGTGKSTFVQYLKDHSSKRLRVVRPTAIAALNVGRVTIHSLFQFPLSDFSFWTTWRGLQALRAPTDFENKRYNVSFLRIQYLTLFYPNIRLSLCKFGSLG